jgi:hypothetical protein
MGLSGERWVADTCHPSVVAAAHEALYDEVLATRVSGVPGGAPSC